MKSTAPALTSRMRRTIQAKMSSALIVMVPSVDGLRLGELPFAVQDFGARSIEPHRVIPALHDWQAVRNLAVAAAELHADRTVGVLFRRDIVERVGVVFILLEVAVGVVQPDGPKRFDRNVLDVELIDRRGVIFRRRDAQIGRIPVRISAPAGRGADQMHDRIDFALWPESTRKATRMIVEDKQRAANVLL